MEFVYNSPVMKYRRKQLRARASKPEEILWQKLKRSQFGARFRRQYSIQSYVIDFFCPEKRIAIEIDGSRHLETEAQKYDIYRDRYLAALEIKTIRIKATEIFSDLEKVLTKIRLVVSPS